MAETETLEETEAPPAGGGKLKLILIVLVSAGLGFAAPKLMPTKGAAKTEKEAPKYPDPSGEMTYLPFGETIVANLNEGRMTRYTRVGITMKIDKAQELEITKEVELRRQELRNWMINHLQGQTLDDIRGSAGPNRLRREIRDQFNSILFPDGYDRIHDILYTEFNVQ